MSDEKPKPFAEVTEEHDHAFLVIAGERMAGGSRAWIRDVASKANAAVEQREAKLRGALKAASEALVAWTRHFSDCPGRSEDDDYCTCGLWADRKKVADALAGAGPDYVPAEVAATLTGMLAHQGEVIRQLQVLTEVLTADLRREGNVLVPFLRAQGLPEHRDPPTPLLIPQGWHLTREQRLKLSKLMSRPVIAVPIERERLMNGGAEDEAVVNAAVQQVLHSRYEDGAESDIDADGRWRPRLRDQHSEEPVVHLRRGIEAGFSVCPHGHGGNTTLVLADVTCDDCRQLHNGRAA